MEERLKGEYGESKKSRIDGHSKESTMPDLNCFVCGFFL
jgi:hypothetical protein